MMLRWQELEESRDKPNKVSWKFESNVRSYDLHLIINVFVTGERKRHRVR